MDATRTMPERFIGLAVRAVTDDERRLVSHAMRWGSDGCPVHKTTGGRWIVGESHGIKGPPTVFRTKREAVATFERFLDLLIDLLAYEAWEAQA